jgi:hypothetical protein
MIIIINSNNISSCPFLQCEYGNRDWCIHPGNTKERMCVDGGMGPVPDHCPLRIEDTEVQLK